MSVTFVKHPHQKLVPAILLEPVLLLFHPLLLLVQSADQIISKAYDWQRAARPISGSPW